MAYQYPPNGNGIRSRGSSSASGKYVPTEYQYHNQNQYQPNTSSSLRPEASPPQTYNPPRPEGYQSNASYQPPTAHLQPHSDPPLPIGEHVLPSSRRASSSRPRLSTDSRPRSDSHRSHHSGHSHYSDNADRGRRSDDSHRHHRNAAASGDRASVRSRRSHHSHHSLRHHFDDDVGREPEPEPLKRRDTRRPTIGDSMLSLWGAAKKSLGLK